MIKPRSTRTNKWSYIPLRNLVPIIDNLFIPRDKLSCEINQIKQENHSSEALEVIFNVATGYYLVVGGFTTYYAHAETSKQNKLIRCKVSCEFRKRKQYLLALGWLNKNRMTTWHTQNEVIPKLTGHFEHTETDWQLF